MPNGATRLAASRYCANQMFALGPHLGMQCHIEMTPEMIATWARQWADEVAAVAHQPSVQSTTKLLAQIDEELPNMRQLADQLYSVWIQGLAR